MKNLRIFLIPAITLLLLSAVLTVATNTGCDLPKKEEPPKDGIEALADMQTVRSFTVQVGPETMTNADTIDAAIGTFFSPIEYEISTVADSLTGSTAGTQYLEWDADNDGANWVRIETMVINGVTTRLRETGTLVGGTLRLRTITSGTQTTRLWHEFIWSQRVPN